jgi:hypothetical protein
VTVRVTAGRLTRGRGRRRVCADAGITVAATMAKSAIKLRARCAKILFVFIINLSVQRPFACAWKIFPHLRVGSSPDNLAMSVPLPARSLSGEKITKTAVFPCRVQTPASAEAICFDEVREGACILHHIV